MSKSEPYNPIDYLETPEDMAEYLNAAIEDGDTNLFLAVLGDVAKATTNMSALANKAGVSRDLLYKSLNKNGNIQIKKLYPIMDALGLELHVRPKI